MTRASKLVHVTTGPATLPVAAAVALAAAYWAGCAAGSPADAAQHPPTSMFTSIGLDTCKPVKAAPDGKGWQCPALMPVYAAERGGRFFLAFGADARGHKAALQSLAVPNTAVEHKSGRITVEWRIKARAAGPAPYASIVRYFTHARGKAGEVLVVTKIGTGQSCHMAYVDALANADAIVLARAFADEKVASFDCAATEPVWIGTGGKE